MNRGPSKCSIVANSQPNITIPIRLPKTNFNSSANTSALFVQFISRFSSFQTLIQNQSLRRSQTREQRSWSSRWPKFPRKSTKVERHIVRLVCLRSWPRTRLHMHADASTAVSVLIPDTRGHINRKFCDVETPKCFLGADVVANPSENVVTRIFFRLTIYSRLIYPSPYIRVFARVSTCFSKLCRENINSEFSV